MSIGIFQLLFIAMVILVLFGRGRISDMMGDFGKGIKSFRQGMSETEQQLSAPVLGPPDEARAAQASMGESRTSDHRAG